MSVKVNDVVKYFEGLYANKAVYLWGANSEVITRKLCDQLYKNYGDKTYNKKYYDDKFIEGEGRIGADCSGAMYPMSGKDNTAQGYYNSCSVKGHVNYLDKSIPCLVFKGKTANAIHHIGFYCGNGYVIEMRSSKENCVKAPLDGHGWNFFGVPLWIDYSSSKSQTASLGVDLSSIQKNADFGKLKNAGVEFAILRTITKDGKADSMFSDYFKKARAAGMKVGAYMYSYDLTEMSAITSAQKVIGLLGDKNIPIFLDLEWDVQAAKLGKAGIKNIAQAFIQTCSKAGYKCWIYCNLDWYKNYIDDAIKPYAVWIARLGKNTGKMDVAYKPNCGEKIWQYSSKGLLNGIQGNVDLDVCYDMGIFNVAPQASQSYTVEKINVMGLVKATDLNIRQEPDTDSPILGKYSNEIVNLIGKTNNGWYQTDKGYISGKYVTYLQGKVVNCNKVNVRQLANKESASLAVIPAGELVIIIAGLGDWYNVLTNKNIIGWIKKDYIDLQI